MITPAQAKTLAYKNNLRFSDLIEKRIDECLVRDMNTADAHSGNWTLCLDFSYSTKCDQETMDYNELFNSLNYADFATKFDLDMQNLADKYIRFGWIDFKICRSDRKYLHVSFTNPARGIGEC